MYLDEKHIFLFLVQLFIILLLARGFGEICRRLKQPAVTAELLIGIILGPTLLGRFCPGVFAWLFPPDIIQQSMLETIAWLGVLFLLLDTGLEIDFSIAWRQRDSALTIALSDIFIPMLVAFVAVVFLPDRFLVDPDRRIFFGLFMATVMTISAMPVAARCMHDLNLLKTDLGFLTMSALAVNDIIGWVFFAIILALFMQTSAAIGPILLVFIGTLGFSALVLTVGRRFSMWLFDTVKTHNCPEPGTSLTITVLLGLLLGAATQALGVHALFGFFLAGVIAGEAKSLSEDTRRVISQMVYSIFVPVFFACIGLKVDFIANFNLWLVLLITVVGIVGRYLGAWFGVTCARVPRVNRNLISIAHTPGGMMEIVVATLALENHLITPPVFVAIVFSALFSSILMGPWLTRAMSRRRKVTPAAFLLPQTIFADLPDDTRAKAVHSLAEAVVQLSPADDAEGISRTVMAREEEYGTALGHGIAIPHVRAPNLRHPILAFAKSVDGIDWDAPDGDPVHFIFFLVSAAGAEDIHVQTLAYISRAMSNAANRKRLADADTPEDLYAALQEVLSLKPAPGTGKC